jgi:hypothetical protein
MPSPPKLACGSCLLLKPCRPAGAFPGGAARAFPGAARAFPGRSRLLHSLPTRHRTNTRRLGQHSSLTNTSFGSLTRRASSARRAWTRPRPLVRRREALPSQRTHRLRRARIAAGAPRETPRPPTLHTSVAVHHVPAQRQPAPVHQADPVPVHPGTTRQRCSVEQQ